MSAAERRRAGRSIPALYGALTASLVVVVTVVASVVAPATPPSIAELSPSARDRIEEARHDQGIGPGEGAGRCAPSEAGCVDAGAADPNAGPGSSAVPSPLEVAAGRRCFGDPPRQTEDPHSPPCVFEIFKGDNGGATAPGVSATEIRVAVAVPGADGPEEAVVKALVAHFNRRYEFYGRQLVPVFVPGFPYDDPAANRAFAEDVASEKPFGLISWYGWAPSSALYRGVADEGIVSVVSRPAGFDSDAVVEGWTWLADPPLDARLQAGAAFVCGTLKGRLARHAGPGSQGNPRKFAVVVLTDASGGGPDPGPLEAGLHGCGADFQVFEVPWRSNADQFETLMLNLKSGGFTTVLPVTFTPNLGLYQSASGVSYFPEWLDLGVFGVHDEATWAGSSGRTYTAGQGDHAFGYTSDVRVRQEAEDPAIWAYREGGGNSVPSDTEVAWWYEPLLVLASGIQGAGPNLTPETFAQALRSTRFPNPNAGSPPYWQQGIGFGLGDFVFHDDYAIWWWNDNAPSQTGESSSGRGSFCYLDRGARFSADAFPADADSRLSSSSEPCR